jgi:beta-barrel assembly-enhancing protease
MTSRARRAVSALGGVALAALLAGHAWPEVRGVAERPAVHTDEGGLWAESDKAEQRARQSGERNQAPELNAYVSGIVCDLAQAHCPDVRVYVMDRPYFNATMAPNGYMEVWSGLLLRAENEAQLSFVLGHELGHYLEEHSIEQWRRLRSTSNAAMFLSVITAVAGVGFVGDIIYLGALASVFGYSREAESEADVFGFNTAVTRGYDPNAGASLWRNLIAENGKSDFEKTRQRMARTNIFSTHPLSADRVAALDTRAKGKPAGKTEAERYRAMIRPHLSAWLRDDLRRRDFGQSLHLIDRLMTSGADLGVLRFFKGEAYRMRRGEGDLARARAEYDLAVAQPDAPAAAWREIGDMAMRNNDRAGARVAFVAYLERAAAAPDKALIEARVASLADVAPPAAAPPITTPPVTASPAASSTAAPQAADMPPRAPEPATGDKPQ